MLSFQNRDHDSDYVSIWRIIYINQAENKSIFVDGRGWLGDWKRKRKWASQSARDGEEEEEKKLSEGR